VDFSIQSLLKPDTTGEIAFSNVWFAYNNDQWVLRDISFSVPPKSTLAIVGSTGSGKTTIISLLDRFYSPQKGKITLTGVDIQQIPLIALRKCIGLVLQDVFLFSGTIYENISLLDKEITLDKIKMAAKTIGANDFIEKLPGGYDFNVNERGTSLSVGQRQIISFIRVMVFNPDILILDEATSSVDSESEVLIQHAILKVIESRTCIIIAHRLSTIRHADKIIVLKDGRIVESGNHRSLLKEKGMYFELFEKQTLESSLANA